MLYIGRVLRHSTDLKTVGTLAQKLVGRLPVTVATVTGVVVTGQCFLAPSRVEILYYDTSEIQKKDGPCLIQLQ